MKVSLEKSRTAREIVQILRPYDEIARIDVLSQILVKMFIAYAGNRKELLIGLISEVFDALEEDANLRGLLPKGQENNENV